MRDFLFSIYLSVMKITDFKNRIMMEQSNNPSMPIIVKLFKILNEEKKNCKTRSEILNKIKLFSKYMGIPEGYELYLLELYMLNYNKDGDYSNLTKDNFIDPRKQKGRTISNTSSNLYTIAQLPFKGSNLEGYWDKDPEGVPYYKVVSYGWYPIYIFKDDKWYEVIDNYSSSTAKQKNNSNPIKWSDNLDSKVYTLTKDEMMMLVRGYSHEELMNNKLKKIKEVEPDLTKRKKLTKTYNYIWDNNLPDTNIKFKVNSIDIEQDKAIVTIDVYDVLNRVGGKEIKTPQNYLKGEIPNLTPSNVENAIKIKMKGELKDYIGKRVRYTSEDIPESKIDFKFNHIKK